MLLRSITRLCTFVAVVACATTTRSAFGDQTPAADLDITLDVEVGQPIMLAGAEQSAFLKITLGGFALPASSRAPVNLAVVLDRSGSMAGDKLEKAKEAALMVIDRLAPDDILSVITYDDVVDVIVPATKVANKDMLRERISSLTPRGSTALFAGVSHGIEEVSKFLDAKRVNRVILLSDGQANVGPRSPNELGRLGEVAGRQGITVTTIGLGLGYNEDLMTQLAMASDGNHGFAEDANDLAKIFTHELGDILSVVARDVEIEVSFADGITPVRALGRDATIHGNKARFNLSQLYAKQQRYVMFEVKVPAGTAGQRRNLADVAVSYDHMIKRQSRTRRGSAGIEFSTASAVVAKRQNRPVMEAVVTAIASDENRRAVTLRDQGKVADAERVLKQNADYLDREAKRWQSKKLASERDRNVNDANNIKAQDWNSTRKSMRVEQHRATNNQSW